MFKLLMFSVVFCQVVFPTSGAAVKESTDMVIPRMHSRTITPKLNSDHNYYASHQTFYFNGRSSADEEKTEVKNLPVISTRKTRSTYKISEKKMSWNNARRYCISIGGHLAVIRTTEDLEALKSAMKEGIVWVGYHDKYVESDWVSVLDEPLNSMSWNTPWTPQIPNNPDNENGDENCATFIFSLDGLNDDNCMKGFSAACDI